MVVLHGLLPHWSDVNRSPVSRHAYSLHCIDATAEYPAWNWLQRPPEMPLRRCRTARARRRGAGVTTPLTPELLTRAPKALLHDHLDGGVRPATVVELAGEYGYQGLPTTDVDDLAHWFNRGAKRNDLVLYLETFAHTIGVMQHKDAIERVAFECAEDLAADGVVYAEVRMAPELCTEAGPDARRGDAGDPRRVRPRVGGHRPDDLRHRHGDAHRGAEPGDRRAGGALPRRRRRRLRHRRRRGRLPADAAPRRLPVRDAGELPHHDPRRRGVRAAEHLGGGAVVRGRAPRSRRPPRRRHHRAARRREPRAPRRLRAGHAASRWSCARRRT